MHLQDADVSVRKRALHLLFVMTDQSNAAAIVDELLLALPSSDSAIKEEMVVKIAILAETFASDLKWYMDTTVQVQYSRFRIGEILPKALLYFNLRCGIMFL